MGNITDKMLGTGDKCLFFIASFSPLWAIMSIRYVIDNYNQMEFIPTVILIITISTVLGSIVLTVRTFRSLRRSTNCKKISVTESKEVTMEYIPYAVSYLFPILVAIHNLGAFFAVIAAMTLVGTPYIKTRMVLTNPALILAGFRIYEVRAKDYTRQIKIISKKFPEKEDDIQVRDMDRDLCIERKDQT